MDDLYVTVVITGIILMIDFTLKERRKFSAAKTAAVWFLALAALYVLNRAQYAGIAAFLALNESFYLEHPILYNFISGYGIWMYLIQLSLLITGSKALYSRILPAHIFCVSIIYIYVSVIADYCMPLLLIALNPVTGESGFYINFERGGGPFYLPVGVFISAVLYAVYRLFICVNVRVMLELDRKQLAKLLCIPIIAYIAYSLIYLIMNHVGIYPARPEDTVYFALIFAVIISIYATMFAALFYGIISTAGYAKIEAELNIAAEIQNENMPREFVDLAGNGAADLAASMKAAKSVSGDFYDYFFVNNRLLAVVIADVSGKGLPASLMMMKAKALIKEGFSYTQDPAEVLTSVNSQLAEKNRMKMFVTAFVGVLDTDTGMLAYVNAGHPYPYIKNGEETFGVFKTQNGLVLGAKQGYTYKGYGARLKKGARLFLYTDGVLDALNVRDEEFGAVRLEEELGRASGANKSMKGFLDDINAAVDNFTGTVKGQNDDITMLVMGYEGHE